jgi:hypothetical protein
MVDTVVTKASFFEMILRLLRALQGIIFQYYFGKK